MGRRVLAFFLGLLFGIILVVGGVAVAVYVAVCVVDVDKYVPDAGKYFGDLSNKPLYDIYKELEGLYKSKLGVTDENDRYYTVGEFFANYNIDVNAAVGMQLPQEVLDIPAFEFFSKGGVERAMKQIKVSTVPAVVNMFGAKDENGNPKGTIGENAVAELSKFSMNDLMSKDVGVKGVFANVKACDLVVNAFPAEDGGNKVMWALGQTKVGGFIGGLGGNFFNQLKQGGSMETLGALPLNVVFGDSQYLKTVMGGNATLADLVDDEGNLNLENIINGISIGELLGCQKRPVENTDGYEVLFAAENDGEVTVKSKAENEKTLYVISTDGENWFEAELICDVKTDEAEPHAHTAECYGYVWYSLTPRTGAPESTDWIKDGEAYPKTTGLYSVLANVSVKDLTSGNDNALMNKIKKLTVGDIIGDTEVHGVMSNFVNMTVEELMNGAIDRMYLGQFFGYYRKGITDLSAYGEITELTDENGKTVLYLALDSNNNVALSEDRENWYEGAADCASTEVHLVHNASCYVFNWFKDENCLEPADGIQGKFANKRIADLTNLNEEVKKLTLSDVLTPVPQMFEEIAHTPIGELESAIESMYVGSAMGYHRITLSNTDDYSNTLFETVKALQTGDKFIKTDDGTAWYEAELDCYDTSSAHAHTADCYKYVWYDEAENPVSGVARAFVNSKLNNVANSMDGLTLRKLGIKTEDNNLLKTIQDMPIMEIGDHINNVEMGEVLGFVKIYSCGLTEGSGHSHTADCRLLWAEECTNNHDTSKPNNHNANVTHYEIDGKNYVEVKGLNLKVADKTVKEMTGSGLTDIAVSLTMGDLIESGMMSLGDTAAEKEENEYKFDIVFDNSNQCSLKNYFIYVGTETAAGREPSAQKYYTSVHGADESYRYAWKELPLSEFISAVLSAF